MHGLINRGLQSFVCEIYGSECWIDICADAKLNFTNFETMLYYDDIITEQVLDALLTATSRNRTEILEDFGTYIVSEHCSLSVLKLLRLGGETFVDFLNSLEDVADRIQIAIPDMETPLMRLEHKSDTEFVLQYEFYKCGYGPVFLGLLRAMADHYGSLVTIDHQNSCVGHIDKDTFYIQVFKDDWFYSKDRAA